MDIDSLTVDADGWLVDVHGVRVGYSVPLPVSGTFRATQVQMDMDAYTALLSRLERAGMAGDKRLHYDVIDVEDEGIVTVRIVTARMGRPVNEPQPRTLVEEVMGL